MKRVWLMWVLLAALVSMTLWTADAAQSQETPADRLETALAAVPGVEVVNVTLAGTRVAAVWYITQETDETAYRAEMLEVLRAVGVALQNGAVQVSTVALYTSADSANTNDLIERVEAQAGELRAFAVGRLTRSELLARLEITELGHSLPGRRPPGRTV